MIRRLADKLLSWYCHPDFYPDISGDLEELHERDRQERKRFSQLRYLLRVIMLFRISLLRPIGQHSFIKNTGMFRNYLKISFRSLVRHRAYTLINVLGLAVGLAAFLLIDQYIRFEKSYDRFHADADQIYRLTTDQIVDGQLGTRDAMSYNPSGKVIMEEIPEVLDYTVSYDLVGIGGGSDGLTIRKGEELVTEQQVIMADDRFINFFGYKVLNGGNEGLLKEPNTIILTKEKAQFYFGDDNPVGKTLHLFSGFDREFEVVGVIDNVPSNTHYKFDMLLSISTIQEQLDQEAWRMFNYYTYLKLAEGVNAEELEARLVSIKEKYIGEESTLFFNLQPVVDIHLHSDFTFEPEVHGSAKAVEFLMVISFFIVLIAWVNYINLSTAKAVDRAKEVGLRKVIGARKAQLRTQFFVESGLINLLGGLLALALAILATPYFNELVAKDIINSLWNDRDFLLRLGVFVFIGTIISGSYPAIFLSNFKIVSVLKGKFKNSKSGVLLRKGLVVMQFSASLILIAGTLIVVQQVNHMRSMETGMKTDFVVGFSNPKSGNEKSDSEQKMKMFQAALLRHQSIQEVANSTAIPGGTSSEIWSAAGGAKVVGRSDRKDNTIYLQVIDDRYFELLNVDFVAGRNFMEELASDSSAVIVNEAFLEVLGLKADESLLDENVQFGRETDNDKYPIVGIIQNATRGSLKNPIEPTCYFYSPLQGNSLVRLSPLDYSEGLQHLEKTWAEFFPTAPLNYSFIDERYNRLYEEDRRFGKVFGAFSLIALFVTALGLFGLSSFMAAQRTKEVGVRKVLGASIPHIISLFYREFIILVGVSAVFGIPVVYFTMNSWLQNYAYRIDFPWLFMIVALLVVLVSAFVTVGFQVYRVAVLDPARTLKYE